MDNRVPIMHLNPVTDDSNCVKRGLFCDNMDAYQLLATPMFKTILLTDATTEDGDDEVRYPISRVSIRSKMECETSSGFNSSNKVREPYQISKHLPLVLQYQKSLPYKIQ